MISNNSSNALSAVPLILNNTSSWVSVNITQSNNSMMTTSIPDGIGTHIFLNKILNAAGYSQPQEEKNASIFSEILSSIRQYFQRNQKDNPNNNVIPASKEKLNISTTHTESRKENSKKDEVKTRVKRMYGNIKNSHTKDETDFAVTLYEDDEPYCSGTIVKDNMVLTAAHCVYGINITSITLGIGSPNKDNQTKIPILSTILHPEYKELNIDFILSDEDFDFNATSIDYEIENATSSANDFYDYYDDYGTKNGTYSEFNNSSISAGEYDLALIEVEKSHFKKHKLPFVRLPRENVLEGMEALCKNPKRLKNAKLWMVGSGIGSKNDTEIPFKNMSSGFLRFGPECIDNTTIHVEFDEGISDGSIWCSGDSGAGVFRIHPRTGRAALIGVVRSSIAIASNCLMHPDLVSILGSNVAGQAVFLSKDMTIFTVPHLSGKKGLSRWEGYPK